MQLADMQAGAHGRIIAIQPLSSASAPDHAFYRQRLLAMGLLPGTEFCLSRIAPLGDPVELSVRGFNLILRKHEACLLEIQSVTV